MKEYKTTQFEKDFNRWLVTLPTSKQQEYKELIKQSKKGEAVEVTPIPLSDTFDDFTVTPIIEWMEREGISITKEERDEENTNTSTD